MSIQHIYFGMFKAQTKVKSAHVTGLHLVAQEKGTEAVAKHAVGELCDAPREVRLHYEGLVVPDSLLSMYAPTGKGKTMLRFSLGFMDVTEPSAQEPHTRRCILFDQSFGSCG